VEFSGVSNTFDRARWANLVSVPHSGGLKVEKRKRAKKVMLRWRAPRNDALQPDVECCISMLKSYLPQRCSLILDYRASRFGAWSPTFVGRLHTQQPLIAEPRSTFGGHFDAFRKTLEIDFTKRLDR
jgi:hypothetical protein